MSKRRPRRIGKLVSLAALASAALLVVQARSEPRSAFANEAEPAPAGVTGLPHEGLDVKAMLEPDPVPFPEEPALPLLRLEKLGTRESVELTPFDSSGAVRYDQMLELSTLFSPKSKLGKVPDPEEVTAIDPRLAELLMKISDQLGGKPLIVVSGHRKPGRGTSRKSFHVRGMAADIAVFGLKPAEVRAAAIEVGAGGVGLYRGFVHVDVREEPYQWGAGRARPRRTGPLKSKR